jgi:tyrosyl-tRNA synthetase
MDLEKTSETYNVITNNLAEVLNGEIIRRIIAEGRSPKIYWGTATTGRPHVGYLYVMNIFYLSIVLHLILCC